MLKLLVLVAIVYAVSGAWFEESSLKWTGQRESQNTYFKGWSLEQVKRMMGTRMDEKPGAVHPVKSYDGVNLASLPSQFTCGIDKCKGAMQPSVSSRIRLRAAVVGPSPRPT